MTLFWQTDYAFKIIQINCYRLKSSLYLLVLHENHIHKSAPYILGNHIACMRDFQTALVLLLLIIIIIKGNCSKTYIKCIIALNVNMLF